ncbi:hypothetical protein [Pseudarthrobacter sp. C4D7]|uniref:hypothetical protein n=1 Tax=Pseudarthrobacter sp. C4D7 TaxID=2735268 RepID=UPI0015846EAA|nr:hypothetical protein [Pseudarthrobacter sp. C4D7]NUT72743.1 hypothetical protein [Pseudarthrobacter sp. C4D7]
MRAFLGFLQIACGIGGVIALFNGQWLAMVGALTTAFVIGLVGVRATKAVNGISDLGFEAIGSVSQAVDLIRRGAYTQAEGVSLGAVNSLRFGGDRHFLPIALTVRAVALCANGKFDAARMAADEAEALSRNPPARSPGGYDEIRPMILAVQRELRSSTPSSGRVVLEFLAAEEAV